MSIYALTEQKDGSTTVKGFLDLEEAKNALLERKDALSTEYKPDEPITDPRILHKYELKKINGSGETVLLRISTIDVKTSPKTRRLEIPLSISEKGTGLEPLWVLKDALSDALDKIQATIYRNETTVKCNNDPNGTDRENAKRTIEIYRELEFIYKNRIRELNELEEHFFDRDY